MLVTDRVDISPTARDFLHTSIHRDCYRRRLAVTVLSVLLIAGDRTRFTGDGGHAAAMSEVEGRAGKAIDGMLTGTVVEIVKVYLAQWLGLDPITLAALAGGMTPFIQGLPEHLQQVAERRAHRVQLAADEACHCAHCDLDELVSRSLADESRIELFSRALEGAQRSADERQVRALGRVLGAGVSGDDAKVDEAMRVVRTIADLDPVDLRVLAFMATRSGSVKRPDEELPRSAEGAVAVRLPGTADVVDSIFARLNTLGLISDEVSGLSATSSWYVTDFGRLCLRELEAVSPTSEDGSP